MTIDVASEDPRVEEDYVKLEAGAAAGGGEAETLLTGGGEWWTSWRWWAQIVAVLLLVAVLAVVCIKWVGPFSMDKAIIPIIKWERKTFSTAALALIVFGSLVIFPSILLPPRPSMWVAGLTFGYGIGFLLIIGGVAIGASIPYFIGSLLYHRIQVWLERHPKEAVIVRVGGAGNWFSQFQFVALIRISPFPHGVYDYCSVATGVKYGPYLLGTLVGMVPDILVALYTGSLIRNLVNASYSGESGNSMSPTQIIINVIGICIVITGTILIALFAKRRLEELRMQEESLLQ